MPLTRLDTDILSDVVKLRNFVVQQHALAYIQQHREFAYSAMTRYEVRRGYMQQGATTQIARFDIFCQQSLILPITDDVLDRAASLWSFARTNGHPHSDADLIIAATALEDGRNLVTANTRHYAWIPGLTLADWRQP